MTDSLVKMLAHLPQAEPNQARAARTRARCHSVLNRRRPRRSPRSNVGPHFWAALVAGLGSVYLMETIHQALRLYGII
jgi:hypothetical protein